MIHMASHSTPTRIAWFTSRSPRTASFFISRSNIGAMDIIGGDAIWSLVCITSTIVVAINKHVVQHVSKISASDILTPQHNTIPYLDTVDKMDICLHNAHLVLINISSCNGARSGDLVQHNVVLGAQTALVEFDPNASEHRSRLKRLLVSIVAK